VPDVTLPQPERTQSERPLPAAQPTGRPLVLWDGDPHAGIALILGRFPAGQMEDATRVATLWAPRYDTLTIGEAAGSEAPPLVLAQWRNGQRIGD